MLLIILYIHIQTFKYINCIINCCIILIFSPHEVFNYVYTPTNLKYINILLTVILFHFIYIYIYIYIPHIVLLHILYIHVQKQESINCIVKCNIVRYMFFPHILLSILYIQLHVLRYINCIVNYNIVPQFCCSYFMLLRVLYIHIQTFKNVLIVLLIVILSHFHISLMFCFYVSCMYIYRVQIYIYTHTHTYVYVCVCVYIYVTSISKPMLPSINNSQ